MCPYMCKGNKGNKARTYIAIPRRSANQFTVSSWIVDYYLSVSRTAREAVDPGCYTSTYDSRYGRQQPKKSTNESNLRVSLFLSNWVAKVRWQ